MTTLKESFCLDEIVSIEKVGRVHTYDLTIPDTHCFFANGILVHNSSDIEETADTLLKCKWPQESENDVGKYIINVAYNRFGPVDKVEVNYHPSSFRFSDRLF